MDVRIEGLRFERGNRVLLDIPSLQVCGNRTTAVLGPNGAGKTTLLRLMAGLDRPSHGRIAVSGTVVGAVRSSPPDVAYVFQENVFLQATLRENLELGLRLRGLPRRARHEQIDEAVHLLGISHLLDRRADRFSGGEGRRASLARALSLRAPLVLLDEPLAGLDRPTYSHLLDELPQVLGAFDATTVLVTHDHHEALRLADDLVVIIDGRVHAAGSKRDVMSRLSNPAVANILGYIVLPVDGRRVAVRGDTLRPGRGPLEFGVIVEEVVEFVEYREIVGRIGSVRVHVTVPATAEVPERGRRVVVHADHGCELTGP